MPEPVRVYLTAGVPHATAPPAAAAVAQLPHNPIPYSFALRALLLRLLRWVEHGEAPPPSAFPSRAAGTLVPVDQFRRMFPKIPNVTTPAGCNRLNVMDHSVQPPRPGAEYPVFVGSVDADGNTAGGIRHPLIEVPAATATGWNLRAKGYGEGDLYNILGALVPFAATKSERNEFRRFSRVAGRALRIARRNGRSESLRRQGPGRGRLLAPGGCGAAFGKAQERLVEHPGSCIGARCPLSPRQFLTVPRQEPAAARCRRASITRRMPLTLSSSPTSADGLPMPVLRTQPG